MKPFFFLNFKAYEQATGLKAQKLARASAQVSKKALCQIVLVVQPTDIALVAKSVSLGVFAQHIDPVGFGSHTGKIIPMAVKAAGAVGAIINHAEDKASDELIAASVQGARAVGLKTLVCAESLSRALVVAGFAPDFIAIEPPELIGGDVSVSTAKPSLISDAVREIKKINPKIKVITGAGIKTPADVAKAVELGSDGVFVASGVVLAKNQGKALRTLVGGFR